MGGFVKLCMLDVVGHVSRVWRMGGFVNLCMLDGRVVKFCVVDVVGYVSHVWNMGLGGFVKLSMLDGYGMLVMYDEWGRFCTDFIDTCTHTNTFYSTLPYPINQFFLITHNDLP